MKAEILVALVFLPLSWAFTDTFPVVSWASYGSNVASVLSGSTGSPLDALLNAEHPCDFDALILIEQPGLHASDLRALSPASALSGRIRDDPSSVQIPYVRRGPSMSLTNIAETLSRHCGAQLLHVGAGQGGAMMDPSAKYVVCMTLPHISGEGPGRKYTMGRHESILSREITTVEARFPKHIFVYTGTGPSHEKRQITPSLHDVPPPLSFAPNTNSTLPTGGILKRYQLLTPALITSLLLILFLIVPVVMMGINALASIQSPLRLDAPKVLNQDKKNQ